MGIELFLNYLKFEKRYSEHTIRAYIDDLNQFIAFLKQLDPDLDFISHPDYKYIRKWIVELNNNGHSSRTINRKLSSLKKYFKFQTSQGKLKTNPFDKIISLKTKKQLPSFLNIDEISLLEQTPIFEENLMGKRDKAIIELLYCTGIRLSELINLKVSEVDFKSNTIKVLGKRNKERIVPFPEELKPILQDYLNERIDSNMSGQYLFTTSKGEKTYSRMIQRIVQKYLALITTNEKKNPHLLRHTYATHLLNNGAEINAIKELLGHANLSATQIYTHNTFQKLNKIYKLAHPRA